jgi:hypothetical protein
MCSRHWLSALKWKIFKYGKIEDIRAQEVDTIILFIFEYRNIPYY